MHAQTATIRCGKKFYRFTIKQTRTGQSYLEITETRVNGLSPTTHQTLYVFPEYATKFAVVLNMMLGNLEHQAKAAPTAEI